MDAMICAAPLARIADTRWASTSPHGIDIRRVSSPHGIDIRRVS
jgi:hypothetical protein